MNSCYHMPQEIVIIILLRLPAKSLERFRSVCKSWYSLITHDDSFRALYFRQFNANNSTRRWIAFEKHNFEGITDAHIAPYTNDTGYFWLYDESFTLAKVQPLPFQSPLDNLINFTLIGSCHGVLCLYENSLDEWRISPPRLWLWNPSIGRHKSVSCPSSFQHMRPHFDIVFGFGFSHVNHDFMLVCFPRYCTGEVCVYSLRTNSWATIKARLDKRTSVLYFRMSGTYFNGACHWVCTTLEENVMILCYDVDDEKLRYVEPPNCGATTEYSRNDFEVFIYKDMLSMSCLRTSDFSTPMSRDWKLWVMKEYGIWTSWTPLLRVVYGEYVYFPFSIVWGGDERDRLLLSKDCFLHGDVMNAWDPRSKEFVELQVPDVTYLAPYEESLALL